MNNLYNSLMGNRNVVPKSNGVSGGQSNIDIAKSIFNMLNNSKNPYQLFMNIASKNPMIKNIIDMSNSTGKSYQDIFYELAKQKGVNPDDILSQLKF